MLGQHRLLAEGDIGAPIYWRTDAPCAITNGAPNTKNCYVQSTYKNHLLVAEQKEADQTFRCAAPIFLPIAY
jgi:hypothetical protein